jgi:hypothetical protein
MHHSVEIYLSWSGTILMWARWAVELLLWFWVVSGAIFFLRFLAFMLTARRSGSSVQAADVPPLEAGH